MVIIITVVGRRTSSCPLRPHHPGGKAGMASHTGVGDKSRTRCGRSDQGTQRRVTMIWKRVEREDFVGKEFLI